jgi:hypothetical protein
MRSGCDVGIFIGVVHGRDRVADLGIVLGSAGIMTGAASILYAHAQVSAARKQAQQATHLTLLESSQQLNQRLHGLRERWTGTRALAEITDSDPGFAAAVGSAGGFKDYILLREIAELFQDAFFLRRSGVMTDAYWDDIVGQIRFWRLSPTFKRVFAFAAERKLLHSDFVGFAEDIFEGRPHRDPAKG